MGLGVPLAALAAREHSRASQQCNPDDRPSTVVLATPLHSNRTRWYRLIRPVVFKLTPDPELAHTTTVRCAQLAGTVLVTLHALSEVFACIRGGIANFFFSSSNIPLPPHPPSTRLSTTFCGHHFALPVGVAAGFDKNGRLADFFFHASKNLRIGHAELGSVSYRPWAGNARPRLFRLEADRGIINRMGLNNEGAVVVASRLSESSMGTARRGLVPIGVNITKTPDPAIEGESAVADFVTSHSFVRHLRNCNWVTLNVSCPNTAEGTTFEDPAALRQLLESLHREDDQLLFLKLAPLSVGEWRDRGSALIQIAKQNRVSALVIGNTVPDRNLVLQSDATIASERGGVSGPPIFERSLPLIAMAAKEGIPVVGVGGVASGKDVFKLLQTGAGIVQLYTSMVYDGPGVFADVHNGLERLLLISDTTVAQMAESPVG